MIGGAALHGVTGKQSTLRIWTCGCTPTQRARLMDAVHRNGELRALPGTADLVAQLRAAIDAPDVLVLSVPLSEMRDVVEVVREVIANGPRVAVVAYCDELRDNPPRIGALAAAGVHQFLFSGVNDCGVVLRAVLESARHQCIAEAVMCALRPCIPAELHPMVEATLARPTVVTDVGSLAVALGVHRKTLFNRCTHAAFLHPAELLTWVRLALVGYLLESTGCTVETIAIELAYPSPTALRNTVKRYTGVRSTDLRSNGGLGYVVARLTARARAREGGEGTGGGGGNTSQLHLV